MKTKPQWDITSYRFEWLLSKRQEIAKIGEDMAKKKTLINCWGECKLASPIFLFQNQSLINSAPTPWKLHHNVTTTISPHSEWFTQGWLISLGKISNLARTRKRIQSLFQKETEKSWKLTTKLEKAKTAYNWSF